MTHINTGMVNICYYYFIFEFLIVKKFLTSDSRIQYLTSQRRISLVRYLLVGSRIILGVIPLIGDIVVVFYQGREETWTNPMAGACHFFMLIDDLAVSILYIHLLQWYVEEKYTKISNTYNPKSGNMDKVTCSTHFKVFTAIFISLSYILINLLLHLTCAISDFLYSTT